MKKRDKKRTQSVCLSVRDNSDVRLAVTIGHIEQGTLARTNKQNAPTSTDTTKGQFRVVTMARLLGSLAPRTEGERKKRIEITTFLPVGELGENSKKSWNILLSVKQFKPINSRDNGLRKGNSRSTVLTARFRRRLWTLIL